jgi:hypothetical protein
VSVAVGAEVLKLSWKLVYLDKNGKKFSSKGLAAQEALITRLSPQQKQVFQWLCEGYHYLATPVNFSVEEKLLPVPNAFSPEVFREFLGAVLLRLRKEGSLSYQLLKALVAADGTLLLPTEGVAENLEVGKFVAKLCAGDVHRSFFGWLGERSLAIIVEFLDTKTPAVFGYFTTVSTLITLHEKYVKREADKRQCREQGRLASQGGAGSPSNTSAAVETEDKMSGSNVPVQNLGTPSVASADSHGLGGASAVTWDRKTLPSNSA